MASYLRNSIQPVIGTIIAGGAGTAIGTYFQDRSHKMADERSQKEEFLQKADHVCDRMFENLDRALHLNKGAMYIAVDKMQKKDLQLGDASVWKRYSSALETWKTGEQRRISEVEIYFGDEIAKDVEDLHRLFNRYDSLVWRAYHRRKNDKTILCDSKGKPCDYRTLYFDSGISGKMGARHREIDIKSREVAHKMITLIKEERCG
mmetsp:Transcript_7950/g.11691  ORF Transcript_7950/g.11691 Transcript_7950/m.11691 type:complete len:205 (+) Transcript_7950:1-615(+)